MITICRVKLIQLDLLRPLKVSQKKKEFINTISLRKDSQKDPDGVHRRSREGNDLFPSLEHFGNRGTKVIPRESNDLLGRHF